MALEHTARAFDSDLQELTRLVAEMGGLNPEQDPIRTARGAGYALDDRFAKVE